jgi:hypothetical protein
VTSPLGRTIVKITTSLLASLALALLLAAPSTGALAKTKAQAKPPGPEARVKMCMDRFKGQYRNGQDGWVFQHGYCLSNVAAGNIPAGGGQNLAPPTR